MSHIYDVVVIGAGSGGLTAAVGLRKAGKKVLLVERERLGGECTNSGCIPSKALLHHAQAYATAMAVAGKTEPSETYRQGAFAYVQSVINDILQDETPEHFSALGIDVLIGEAIFTGKNSLAIGDTSYSFKKAIIATGSSPRQLEILGLAPGTILTNQNFFTQTTIPNRLLVIGGGPIGLEMGQALAMLGSRVTIVENGPRVAHLEDESISPIITKVFLELGVSLHCNASVQRIINGMADVEIQNMTDGTAYTTPVAFDKVLIAIGRVPNIPRGLKAAGIIASPFGITVNKNWQTSQKNIYALGDVAARLKFTHVADDTARQVVAHIVSHGVLSVREKSVPKVTYTAPEIAQVGLSWSEAKDSFASEAVMRVEVPFSAVDRARTDTTTDGLLIVIVKRLSGKILGAHMIGPRAGEIISTLTLALEQNISLYRLRSTIFPYPTYSLVVKKAGDYFLAQQLKSLKTDILYAARKQGPKILIALLWLCGLIALVSYQQGTSLSVGELSLKLFTYITMAPLAPLVYIVAYAVRPITFFPGTALTILSGVFFGLWGVAYTIIGANLSAALAYGVGRYFSGQQNSNAKQSLFSSWATLLNKNPFEAILTMRLIFLPFDLVNYGAGLLRLSFVPYSIATFLGTLLGITTFVAIGASISVEEFAKNGITTDAINAKFIVFSVFIFLVSIGISKFLKARKSLVKK